jgi:UDP-galactopyranose mutase
LTGACAAWWLNQHGWHVEVHEATHQVGGNLRVAYLNGVPYEPHGPHIFHTSSREAYTVMRDHSHLNNYKHHVLTQLPDGRHLTWPLQLEELQALPEWPKIAAELDALSGKPEGNNFEAYAVSLMGRTLYEWCCEGYTWKQWGQDPKTLAASFAPKRLDLRSDGRREMFRNTWEGYNTQGWHVTVNHLLRGITVYTDSPLTLSTLPAADAYVVTAPLDQFLEVDQELPWRGVRTVAEYVPTNGGFHLPAPVVNRPDQDVQFTRQVETSQMAWHDADPRDVRSVGGTVVCTEYPGEPVKHYPVDDVDGRNRHDHRTLVTMLRMLEPRAVLAGRLANYVYIDMDQAIMQGLNAARQILRGTRE